MTDQTVVMFAERKFIWVFASILTTALVCADQASFVANTNNGNGQQDPVVFDAVHINRGDALHQDTWRVHIQSHGLFLVTLSAGHAGAGGHTNYSLQRDGSMMTSVYSGPRTAALDHILGLDIVSFFFQLEELHIRSDSSSLITTPLGKLTSWGVVSLSHEMGITIAFGVARTTPNDAGKISFDRIWANTGNIWDSSNNTFVAPVSGIYFFSFTMGLPPSSPDLFAHLRLYVNGQNRAYMYRGRYAPFTTESFGRSILIHLMANDQVHVQSDYPGYSDAGCLTTFSGFLYNSLRNEQIAWAVYLTDYYFGSADPLAFQHVEVNEGGVWADNRATCILTGLYYVHISAGVYPGYYLQMTVMKGSSVQGELRRVGVINASDGLSRSMIVQCNAGEKLRVTVTNSRVELHTTAFVGFYLFN